MPWSEFSRMYKAALMLQAREKLQAVYVANFTDFNVKTRKEVIADWKQTAKMFLEKKVKDYRDVFANIAKGLPNGR